MNVLISAYACGPYWGSEIGMGWNWIINISNFCQLTVITEKGFEDDINKEFPNLKTKYKPQFVYIDIGEKGRKLFWKQGSFLFYHYYKKWQKKVYKTALNLIKENNFDIVHQLNIIGFREPGYLWKIKNIPYIIGPIGGYSQFPYRYYSLLSLKDALFYISRNLINNLQISFSKRPKLAYKKACRTIIATPSGFKQVSKYSNSTPIIIPETGSYKLDCNTENSTFYLSKGKLNLCWVGINKGSKALKIALKALAKTNNPDKFILHIIGDETNNNKTIALAKKLNLNNIIWHGRIENSETKKIMGDCDLLFFTSLLEATSTVVFEALERNTPVLCHDAHGFGNVIDKTCGIKIAMKSPKNSINEFAKSLDYLLENPNVLIELKKGCSSRLEYFLWSYKTEKVYEIYKKCKR